MEGGIFVLRDEVENSIIRNKGFKEDGDINISDSFVGNSLGGLYQRYAISQRMKIPRRVDVSASYL